MFKEFLKIIKKGIILSFGQIGAAIIQFILLPIYTRILQPSEFGILELMTIYSSILCLIIIFGIRQGFTKNYLFKEKKIDKDKDTKTQSKIVVTAIMFIFMWGIFLVVLLSANSESISRILFDSSEYSYFITISSLWALGLAMCQMYHAYLINNDKLKIYVTLSVLQVFINLSLSIYLVVVKKNGIEGVIIANTISNFSFGIISNLWIIIINRASISYEWLIIMLKFGAPSMVGILLITLFDMIDRLFLNHYLGLLELGMYSIGRKYVSIISIILTGPFMSIWTPYSFKIANEKDHKEKIATLLPIFVSLFSFFCLFFSLFAPFVIPLIATEKYIQASNIVIWLSMTQTTYIITTVFLSAINISNRPGLGAFINFLVLIFGVIFNYTLVPHYGLIGAAISTFLTFNLQSIIFYKIGQKIYNIPYNLKKIAIPYILTFIFYWSGLIINTNVLLPIFQICLIFILLILYIITLFYLVFNKSERILIRRKISIINNYK